MQLQSIFHYLTTFNYIMKQNFDTSLLPLLAARPMLRIKTKSECEQLYIFYSKSFVSTLNTDR